MSRGAANPTHTRASAQNGPREAWSASRRLRYRMPVSPGQSMDQGRKPSAFKGLKVSGPLRLPLQETGHRSGPSPPECGKEWTIGKVFLTGTEVIAVEGADGIAWLYASAQG